MSGAGKSDEASGEISGDSSREKPEKSSQRCQPKVSWVYALSKTQLFKELGKYNEPVSADWSIEALRKLLVKLVRKDGRPVERQLIQQEQQQVEQLTVTRDQPQQQEIQVREEIDEDVADIARRLEFNLGED